MKYSLLKVIAATAAGVVCIQASLAAPFDFIRIGDEDGFGFTSTNTLVRSAPGGPADTNGNGLLQAGEFLPDLNKNGAVASGNGDDFDNRSAAELSNTLVQGSGFTSSAGTSGSQWTDISLSTSFAGPNFPDPTGPGFPNEALFQFRFSVAKTDIAEGSSLYFNLLFGDYDVSPANVLVTKNNGLGAAGLTTTIALTVQPGSADGLIQPAFLNLSFGDVFSDAGSQWNGFLDVKFNAPAEPYTAWDFAELSLTQIPVTSRVPDSGTTLILMVPALALLGCFRRRSA